MTTLSRGLASLRRAAHHSRSLHLPTHASAIARPFTTQTSWHAEGSGPPDFKNIKFPSFPLGIAPKAKSANERRLDQVQKLETSTALPSNFPTIPPIPPRPAPGLTPWITDEEAHQYLAPLLARQWSVARYRDPKSKTKVHYQLLSKLFVLRREKDATEFSMCVSEIITKMAHHPTVHKIQGKEVVFRVLTHDAYVMEKDGKPIVTPGITMHDIRLAMRIEKLWDKFWEKGRARLPRQGWTFTGRKRLTVRYWGIREAKLVPEWRQDLNASRKHLREKFLQAQGKKASTPKRLQRPRQQTPRWKKMKWRNQSKRRKVDAVGENTEAGASV